MTDHEEESSAVRKRKWTDSHDDNYQQSQVGEGSEETVSKRLCYNERKEQSRRQRRGATDSNAGAAVPLFLPFHLTILRSLYPDDNFHHSTSPDASMWRTIGEFLQQRPALQRTNHTCQQLTAIHAKAEQIVARNTDSKSDAGTTALLSPRSPSKRSQNIQLNKDGSSSLTLIARLLGRRAKAATNKAHCESRTFQALQQKVDQLLLELEHEMNTLRTARVERNQQASLTLSCIDENVTSSSDDDEEGATGMNSLAELATKIRLWQMLQQSLRSVNTTL